MTINGLLFAIVAADAFGVLLLGAFAAVLKLLGKENEMFFNRIVPACLILMGTSFAAGVILWIGDYMFM